MAYLAEKYTMSTVLNGSIQRTEYTSQAVRQIWYAVFILLPGALAQVALIELFVAALLRDPFLRVIQDIDAKQLAFNNCGMDSGPAIDANQQSGRVQ